MDNDLNLKILESYVEIDKIHDNINNKLYDFIMKANELVELSEDDYQIERTLKLNKISLKDYVLISDCCNSLKENYNLMIETLIGIFTVDKGKIKILMIINHVG